GVHGCGGSSDSSATGGTSTGGTSTGGASTGGASTGGTSTGGTSTGGASTGGTSSGGTSAGGTDAGSCDALKVDLDAKLAEASACTASTPNPSSCIIFKDGLCDCAAVLPGYEGPYLQAAKAFKDAGCEVACPGAICPSSAVCDAPPGSAQ